MTRNRKPEYDYTNESLQSIAIGLDIQPGDVILAVCGSGDQSFALLENARAVVSVDKSKVQLEYAKRRAELLREGRFDEFLDVRIGGFPFSMLDRRNLYFRQDGRLPRIVDRLDSLYFFQADVFAVQGYRQRRFPEGYFSKVYLSNVVGGFVTQMKNYCRSLEALYRRLPQGGLIYVSDYSGSTMPLLLQNHYPQLHVDKRLTALAIERENESWWAPTVFRKL